MFERLISLIGQEEFNLIQSKKVLVLGLGGVGGYIVEGLVRSGIKNITIVDKDIIDITNLNRQIIALKSTIGKNKTEIMKNRILDINDNINVITLNIDLNKENIKDLNIERYDYIIDAIDDVKVKIELIKYALEQNLNLICSTGTAKKMHPELLKMTTLDKTQYDPLAKKLRTQLKGYKLNKIKVLASDEKPMETKDNILGSSIFVPAVGGLIIASHVINEIINNK